MNRFDLRAQFKRPSPSQLWSYDSIRVWECVIAFPLTIFPHHFFHLLLKKYFSIYTKAHICICWIFHTKNSDYTHAFSLTLYMYCSLAFDRCSLPDGCKFVSTLLVSLLQFCNTLLSEWKARVKSAHICIQFIESKADANRAVI